ncbi:hypothetical protein GCM10027048_27710 [Hymenobacter coalescens]
MSLAARGFGHLSLGGASRPFQLGLYQARAFCEAMGIELGAYREKLNGLNLSPSASLEDELVFRAWIYSALKAGAALEKQPFDFDVDEVSFWVDQAPVSQLTPFFEVLKAQQDTAPAEGNAAGQPAKKAKAK